MYNEVIRIDVPGKKRALWNVRKNGKVCDLRFPTYRLAHAYLANRLTKRELQKHVLTASPAEFQLQLALLKTNDAAQIALLRSQLDAAFETRTGMVAK
jgi:hypothetical protein